MIPKFRTLRALVAGAVSMALVAFAVPQASFAASNDIKAIVNGQIITAGDLSRRVNFMKLRHVKGNLPAKAREELVNEVLMRAEIVRTGRSVSTDEVDAAYKRFAQSNKMTVDQLGKILNQAGVGADHFKAYIGIQMSWPRVVQMRFGGGMSNDDFVQRLRQDGKKPTTNEYFLQQVIFVVPASKRGIAGKRKGEAEASRKKYPGCEQARAFAATMHDVSIRDVGRLLEPQLPPDWKDQIIKAPVGGTTPTHVTDRGVEYIAICKKRAVSDDFAAQVVYQEADLKKAEKQGEDPNSKKYIEELRSKAQIELH